MDIFLYRARRLSSVVVILTFVGAAALPLHSSHAQPAANLPLDVSRTSFVEGAAKVLVRSAAPRLEVSVLGDGMLYTRGQAKYILRDFFDAHPPSSFEIEKISPAGASWFVSGRYTSTHDGAAYGIYVRLRDGSSGGDERRWEIREIHISRHDS